MTTRPAASRFQDNSLLGIGAGIIAAVAVGKVCSWAHLDQYTTTTVMGLALGLPAALEVQIQSRRRDANVDIARIERGDLRRPVALVVMLLAAAIVLLHTAFESMTAYIQLALSHLPGAGKIYSNNTAEVWHGLSILPLTSFGMCLFLVASYASHYFAKRPYLWTATAVGCALAVKELVMLMLRNGIREKGGSLPGVLVAEVLIYLGFLVICMVGVWLGRRYHEAFLAKKLARMKDKAAREAAKQHQQNETTPPQDSDPIKQIERLAHLRDTHVLTEEEFHAALAHVLGTKSA